MNTVEIADAGNVTPREAYQALAQLLEKGKVQKGKSGGANAPAGQKSVRWRITPVKPPETKP